MKEIHQCLHTSQDKTNKLKKNQHRFYQEISDNKKLISHDMTRQLIKLFVMSLRILLVINNQINEVLVTTRLSVIKTAKEVKWCNIFIVSIQVFS